MNDDGWLVLEHLRRYFTEEELWQLRKKPLTEVRRELAEISLHFFCEYYLAPYFDKPFAGIHRETIADIERLVETPDAGLALAWPRKHGKTTVASIGAPLWCAVTGRKHHIPVIMDSFTQAKGVLAGLKDLVETSDRLRQDYGDLRGDTWSEAEVVLQGPGPVSLPRRQDWVSKPGQGIDCQIAALGRGMKIRGRLYKRWPPDLVIADDLENDENVQSPAQRAKLRRWVFRAVLKGGAPGCNYLFIGTRIHYDCLMVHLLKYPLLTGRLYKAVLSFSSSGQLWEEWEGIVTNLENPERMQDARRFYEAHEQEMLKGAEVLWPEGMSYYRLMVMRVEPDSEEAGIALSSFSAEMMNEPVAEGERAFERLWYWHEEVRESEIWLVPDQRGEAVKLADCTLYGACDPSLGRTETADFAANLVAAVSPGGRQFMLEADIARRHPDRIVDVILDQCTRHRIRRYGIESNSFQVLLTSATAKEAMARGKYPGLIELEVRGDKALRIRGLQPDVANGYILFHRSHRRLNSQMLNWPAGDHDDGPDALQQLVTLVREDRTRRTLPGRLIVGAQRQRGSQREGYLAQRERGRRRRT